MKESCPLFQVTGFKNICTKEGAYTIHNGTKTFMKSHWQSKTFTYISIGYNSHVLRDKGIYIIPMMTEGEKIGMKIIKGGQNLPGIGNWSAKNWFRHHWIQFLRLWQKFELSKKIHFIQWN